MYRNPIRFPSIYDDPTIMLSLIVPAYNEETRLGAMLKETIAYLKGNPRWVCSFSSFLVLMLLPFFSPLLFRTRFASFEIIVVDDGSKDNVSLSHHKTASVYLKTRLLSPINNYGFLWYGVESSINVIYKTSEIAQQFSRNNEVRVCVSEENRGKGGAVRKVICLFSHFHTILNDSQRPPKKTIWMFYVDYEIFSVKELFLKTLLGRTIYKKILSSPRN